MKIVTAVVVGLIAFSYAGVASAWVCGPRTPKVHEAPSFTPHQMSQIQMMLMAYRGY